MSQIRSRNVNFLIWGLGQFKEVFFTMSVFLLFVIIIVELVMFNNVVRFQLIHYKSMRLRQDDWILATNKASKVTWNSDNDTIPPSPLNSNRVSSYDKRFSSCCDRVKQTGAQEESKEFHYHV